jgi:hypothetical protein
VQQEVYGFLLVHYAIRSLMHQAALDAGIDPDRVSFTRTLRLVRRQVPAQAALSPSRLARALTRALAEIQRHLLKRRLRSNPRVIKRKMSNWKLKRDRTPQPTPAWPAASRHDHHRRSHQTRPSQKKEATIWPLSQRYCI